MAVQIIARHRAHRLVHGLVVVGGGDDQVAACDQIVFTHVVVVDEGAAWRFDDADPAALTHALGKQVATEQRRVIEQLTNHLDAVQHLDHARPVVGQRGVHQRAVTPGHKRLALHLGALTGNEVAVLHPRQRPHAVPAQCVAQAAQVRKLHVAPGAHFFFDEVQVTLVFHPIKQDFSGGIAHPQHAVIKIHRAIGAHQGHQVRLETAKVVVQRRVLRVQGFGDIDRVLRPLQHLRQVAQQGVALLQGHQFVDAARHRAGAVYTLARSDADHLLAKFAQQDAFFGDVGMRLRHTHNVALRHLGVKPKQQVRRRQVKKVQRVRLHELPVMHQAAHGIGAGAHGGRPDDAVKGFGCGQMVRHRADAAQALNHYRHLPVRAAFDEFLETPELHNVQTRLLDAVVLVQQQRDLAVPFDARHRVNRHAAQALGVSGGF